jgi:hypothetical protein
MSLHNGGKHPEFDGVDLETYGQVKIGPISGSVSDSQELVNGDWTKLTWENNQFDPQSFIGDEMSYVMNDRQSPLRGKFQLKFKSSGSIGVPQFKFGLFETGSVNSGSQADLNASSGSYWQEDIIPWNDYLRQEWSVTSGTGDVEYELEWYWGTDGVIPSNRAVYPMIRYDDFGGSNFTVTLAPDGDQSSYWEVDEQVIAADWRVMDIADQMPVGESGIKMIDFIQAVQKKFNLIMYPSKTKPKEFIVETFNNWYKQGEVKDFNKYINLDQKLEVIPANNHAVNKLKFGHTADNDLLSQNFKKETNRPYGESFFIDTQNFFSQGEFKVEPADAASPLRYVGGTGLSGSSPALQLYEVEYQRTSNIYPFAICDSTIRSGWTDNPLGVVEEGFYIYTTSTGQPLIGQYYVGDPTFGNIYRCNPSTGEVLQFETNCIDEPTS